MRFPAVSSDQMHCLSDVAVDGYNHGTVVAVEPGIVQQVQSKIDVGSLFFGLDYVREAL